MAIRTSPISQRHAWFSGHRDNPAPVKSLPPAGATADEPPFHKGDRVQHPQFGKGKVMSVEADKVTIAFDKPAGTKVVIESYVKPG